MHAFDWLKLSNIQHDGGKVNIGKMFSSSNKVEIYTEKLAYQPGETIRGTVVTKVVSKQAVKGIYLYIEGSEKTKIITTTHLGNGRTIKTASRQENLLINNKYLINDFVGQIDVGEYSIPFEIKLPNVLPNSFPRVTFCNEHYGEIKYTLKAEVEVSGTFSYNWKFENEFIVYNPTRISSAAASFSGKGEKITSCCCVNQGTFDASITINGDVYGPGDVISGNLNVVSDCSKKLKCQVGLRRQITLSTGQSFSSTDLIAKTTLPSIVKKGKLFTPFSITIPSTDLHTNHESDLISCQYSVVYSIGYGWFSTVQNGPLIVMKHHCEMIGPVPQVSQTSEQNYHSKNSPGNCEQPPAYFEADSINATSSVFQEKADKKI